MVERKRVQVFFNDPSRTKQEFKDECDLALTIKRFQRTPEGRELLNNIQNSYGGQYLDVSSVPDFRAARDAINAANASFMALPAIVRRRFDNDPALFLDFCSNPANLAEMRSLGLAKPATVNPGEAVKPVSEVK